MSTRLASSVLAGGPERLVELARAWLAGGATSFGVWVDGALEACWPPGCSPEHDAGLRAPVRVRGRAVGLLQVTGVAGAACEARLAADAALLGRLVGLESDMEGITSELIESQDLVLALYGLVRAARSSLDPERALLALLREAVSLLKAEGGYAVLRLASGTMLEVQDDRPWYSHDELRELLDRVGERGRELLFEPGGGAAHASGVRSMLAVPIWIDGAVRAALGLVNAQRGRFQAPDVKLAQAIADFAGSQLENALLHQERLTRARVERELQLAAEIQQRLLPRTTPCVEGLDMWAASRPASNVGGDFYDARLEPGGSLWFGVGDVAGHGLPAALVMAMTRSAIRSKTSLRGIDPAETLARVNEDLYEDLTDLGVFVTAFVAWYDPRARALSYANAGHAPIVLCRRGQPARLLQADGTALGILPTSFSRTQRVPLGPGDVLVVATDGLSEASGPGGALFGNERLMRLVEELAGGSAADIGQGLLHAVDAFGAGAAQDDDQTLMVVRATAG